MIFDTIWAYLYYMFLLVCCAHAIFRGARTEYFGAAIMVAGSLSTLAIAKMVENSWTGVEAGMLAVDMIALAALIALALRSDRFWPMWATAFHLLAVSIHTAMAVAPQITPWAFATVAAFWAYPMLLALAIGSHEHAPILANRETDPR